MGSTYVPGKYTLQASNPSAMLYAVAERGLSACTGRFGDQIVSMLRVRLATLRHARISLCPEPGYTA
ncbi:unannotated protein [freshwater metagenome]|uniref:Unannotated protein n=1 Tax=freshwater metagenome TaxID=449393 RepID=A0A6J6X3A0_9ZZZZ